MLLFFGCLKKDRIEPSEYNSISVDEIEELSPEKFKILRQWRDNLFDGNYDMVEIEIDSCRFYLMEGYGEQNIFIHKPVCPNIKHQNINKK